MIFNVVGYQLMLILGALAVEDGPWGWECGRQSTASFFMLCQSSRDRRRLDCHLRKCQSCGYVPSQPMYLHSAAFCSAQHCFMLLCSDAFDVPLISFCMCLSCRRLWPSLCLCLCVCLCVCLSVCFLSCFTQMNMEYVLPCYLKTRERVFSFSFAVEKYSLVNC